MCIFITKSCFSLIHKKLLWWLNSYWPNRLYFMWVYKIHLGETWEIKLTKWLIWTKYNIHIMPNTRGKHFNLTAMKNYIIGSYVHVRFYNGFSPPSLSTLGSLNLLIRIATPIIIIDRIQYSYKHTNTVLY